MNPLNFGGELKTPSEMNHNRVNWIPFTPGKQIHRSDPVNPLSSNEWQELTGIYSALIQEPAQLNGEALNFNPMGAIQNVGSYGSNGDLAERNRVLNSVAGSYAQAFNVDRSNWNNNSTFANLMQMRNAASVEQMNIAHRGTAMVDMTLRGTNVANTQLIPDLHFQESNWRRPYANTSAPANNVSDWLGSNQLGTCNSNNRLGSNQLGTSNNNSNNWLGSNQPSTSDNRLGSNQLGTSNNNSNNWLGSNQPSTSDNRLGSNQLGTSNNNSNNWLGSNQPSTSDNRLGSNQLGTSNSNNWLGSNQSSITDNRSGSNLLGTSNMWLGSNHLGTCNSNNWLSSNELGSCNSLSQIPPNGFPLPYRPNYNLNLPPITETDATTSIKNSVQTPTMPHDEASQFENGQLSAGLNLLIDVSSSKGKCLGNFTNTAENEAIQNTCNELQNIVDSSSTAISTPLKENKDLEKVSDQDIDLNMTPQQKAPKRKKIRPKVVIEGKSKRVPTSAGQSSDRKDNQTVKRKYVRKTVLQQPESQHADAMKSSIPPTPIYTDSKQNATGKRKYVRKKGVTEPSTQQADIASSTTDTNAGTATKSCRRGLNFELEKDCDGDEGRIRGQEEAHQNMRPFNLNLDFPATELCTGINSLTETRSAGQNSQQYGTRGTGNLTPSMNNMLSQYISLLGRRAAVAPQASMNGQHRESSNASSREIGVRNTDPWKRRSECGYTPRQQNIYTEGIGQVVFPASTANENIETTRPLMSQSRAQQLLNTFPHCIGARGSKRGYQQMVQQEECYRGTDESANLKKSKFENGHFRSIYDMPFVKPVEEVTREASTRCNNEIGTNSFTTQVNHEILNSYLQNCKSPRKPSEVNNFPGNLHSICVAAEKTLPLQHTHELHSNMEILGKTKHVTQVQSAASTKRFESHNPYPLALPQKDSAPRNRQVKRTYQATAPPGHQQTSSWNNLSPMQSKGPPDSQQYSTRIEEIIMRFECLNLKESDTTMVGQEQKAIVIYKGDGAIVLHETKKRKARPKVDLDPETNRIWKLLMGNEGSDGIEGTDKEKWWAGERAVFRGRADSFIARMHLVQGDRRFSPWKGSVVDSVIGVFLTQNVSDHLSSSAFMCLAARFPLSSTSNEAYNSDGKSILVEEPEDCVVNIDDSIKSLEKIPCLPVYNSSSINQLEITEQRKGSEASGTERTSFTEVQSQSIEEEVISSQGSYDSSVVQDNGGIRSSSGSNSEAEDPRNGCIYKRNLDSNPTSFQAMEKTAIFHECCSHISESSIFEERSSYQSKQLEHMESGMTRSTLHIRNCKDSESTYPIISQDPHVRIPVSLSNNCHSHMTPEIGVEENTDMFRDKSTSPWSSAPTEFIKAKEPNCVSNLIADNSCDSNIQNNEQPRSQEVQVLDQFELSSSHQMQQSIPRSQPHVAYDQLLPNSYPSVSGKSYQLEKTLVAEAVKHAESVPNWKNCNMQSIPNVPMQLENTSVKESVPVMKKQEQRDKLAKPKEQFHSSAIATNEMNNKTKKVKAEKEGKQAFDWDSLRKNAQATGKKERSKNAMDTMDYEAMRCADVREIADAIKERGMNNMLADRIKGFLNRLVSDHGSIDLEWLRDVPADKAKEYLLSIRGLGLKSVECVRLLTLHQLAFPVDTNVGRIAVRLGWVPIQPLPESLQLHLLEMYPMLESVQKYLWPRLCKLDQRTLYELHYQMITFGKVYCTKNKPNCNACPMKGECRHFASAFASARLALPAPEEKSIVSSTFPTAQENNYTVVINPMPLLKEAGPDAGNCNPIIEEPATPEPEKPELSQTDIEDMFDEDPDEIPTINLNIETFTENLQKYMSENMELQEGDMSKALVALNPEAAAIPTPLLKSVSRLRTEHLVYELPDSHPLLAEMEQREPDDPSPYLLAIWTPGETADSVQPPDVKCSFRATGKLCNEKTCFSCSTTRESNSQIVRGTILIPCRTAMRGSFPLNGTYFQVNEMFADHDSSVNPIDVPRAWIWNLPRKTVYFGTSVSTIFKGLSTPGIQACFWKGFVCVRGFDHKTRAPRPLSQRLHQPQSKMIRQ